MPGDDEEPPQEEAEDVPADMAGGGGEVVPQQGGDPSAGGGQVPYDDYGQQDEDQDAGRIGMSAMFPIKRRREQEFEIERNEGEQLRIPNVGAPLIGYVVLAEWGNDDAIVDVTDIIRNKVVGGSLNIEVSEANLGKCEVEGQPVEARSLTVRWSEAYYTSPEERLAGIDPTTPEGQLTAVTVEAERLESENVRIHEQLARATRREQHYKDVERRLQREVHERAKLQEAVYENEGTLVAVHVQELERDNARLRRQLTNERAVAEAEQAARQKLEEEIAALREVRSGAPETLESEVALMRRENERLGTQVRELSRLNTALQSTLRDQAEIQRLRDDVLQAEQVDLNPEGAQRAAAQYVRVRRSALCATCSATVDTCERMGTSRAAAQHWQAVPAEQGTPPPQASAHARTTTLLRRPDASPYSASPAGVGTPGRVAGPGARSRPPILPRPSPGAAATPGRPTIGGVGSPAAAAGSPAAGSGWREFLSPEGRPVYHNVLTAATQWDRPAGLGDTRR